MGVDWDEVWWVGLGCAVRQEIVDRREGWLELVLLGLSMRYDDNQLGTANSTYSVRHICFNIEILVRVVFLVCRRHSDHVGILQLITVGLPMSRYS